MYYVTRDICYIYILKSITCTHIMGQKKPARANRVGVWVKREKDSELREILDHESTWYANFHNAEYSQKLEHDWLIRKAITDAYGDKAGISRVKIDRKTDKTFVNIYAIRPGNLMGRDNSKLDKLKSKLRRQVNPKLDINLFEASYTDPKIIAERIAIDLEKRIAFRKACKTALSKAISSPEVLGLKITVGGRLSGAEIARDEWYLEGTVPLHTLHANIDNGFAEANTTYGKIGVKVVTHRVQGANYERSNMNNGGGERRHQNNNRHHNHR